jgi:CRISPR/Cas system CMR-associated protein Cmr5 small subunit
MSRKTLDQIRVAVALESKGRIARGQGGGDKIKNFPTMIQNNGLLGALSFAVEAGGTRNQSEYDMAGYIVEYLNRLKAAGYSVTGDTDIENQESLITFLTECTPAQFRRINAEVTAFLNYFRRFAS